MNQQFHNKRQLMVTDKQACVGRLFDWSKKICWPHEKVKQNELQSSTGLNTAVKKPTGRGGGRRAQWAPLRADRANVKVLPACCRYKPGFYFFSSKIALTYRVNVNHKQSVHCTSSVYSVCVRIRNTLVAFKTNQ